MGDEKPQGMDDLAQRDGVLHADLWYPRCEGPRIREVQVGLMDVRAADDIRISYDFERDGWVIKQAVTYEAPWDGPEDGEEEWREVAFVKAWALEVPKRASADAE